MSSIRFRSNAWAFHGLTIPLLSRLWRSMSYSTSKVLNFTTLCLLCFNGTLFFIVYIKFITYHFHYSTYVFCLLHHRIQRSFPTFNFGKKLLIYTKMFAFKKLKEALATILIKKLYVLEIGKIALK